MHQFTFKAALLSGAALVASLMLPTAVFAQVSSINSAIVHPRVFNDIPTATFGLANNYPVSLKFTESNVSAATGFANRDVWYFSNDGGGTNYSFQNNDFFQSSFQINMSGGNPALDLEAGYLFSNPTGSFGGDCQLIIKGNGEVVQFGGPSFHGFSASGDVPAYTLGSTYTMGFNYVLDPNTNTPAFQYSVNGVFGQSSPGNTYFDLGPGATIASGQPATLGGYFQIQNDPNNATNTGQVTFSNITITPVVVPEPASMGLLALAGMALAARRRSKMAV